MGLNNSSEGPKPAKRIVVGKQSLAWTQKIFPFIKDYKQLVNWIFALVFFLIILGFSQKVLVKSGIWSS